MRTRTRQKRHVRARQMTSRPPTRRLVDVLRQNSKKTLDRHAAQLAAAASSLAAEAIQTRFLRNQFLINPKAVHLLCDPDHLARWHVFGVYKPPFCPMRRSEAADNYHGVSIESFVEAALQSNTIYPVLRRAVKPSDVRVRVLYNLDSFASGPVLVSVSDTHRFTTSLATTTMQYDALVYGHLPVHGTGNHTSIDTAMLFPGASPSSAVPPAVASTSAHYEVKENGYYSVHPVSLLHVVIRSPPTSQPPALERFARELLGTCVVGDPLVMGELMRLRSKPDAATGHDTAEGASTSQHRAHHHHHDGASHESDGAARAAALKMAANPHIVSMRGDCDFPRVFMHLREVNVDTTGETPSADAAASGAAASASLEAGFAPPHAMHYGSSAALSPTHEHAERFAQQQGIQLHCRKCFDGLVQKQLTASFKSRRIGLLDGTWTPQTEFL